MVLLGFMKRVLLEEHRNEEGDEGFGLHMANKFFLDKRIVEEQK